MYTGLVEAADNEAELASVLAHEIGHIASHLVEQMQGDSDRPCHCSSLDRNTAVQIVWNWHYSVPTVGRMNLKQIEGTQILDALVMPNPP